ncbi:RNA-binding protein NOB1 [Coccidioides immitis RS]|uniref:20S-pre-rRNA D-site endonuclease NOB1 n=2 Tax=Coccidioides immitis TaxID=5501 RepID=J3K8K4_COCIM|nr:RNA-binding protein NOB1 [Coccidioides immitis RS]EAS31159.3 RNA-binding protein NOB1 [Coccidioides immitis RS]KMU83274.1 20S-pre-rRNA D-site endonuclease NOB1 [Coccidioides immitis H538.4]TPX24005.1 Nin1 binding protein [Coccidioides immitis]
MTEPTETSAPPKPVHTIVLDAGPLIKNIPPISTLLAQSHVLLTTPAVVSEIRDPDARQRVETLYLPFVERRSPKPESLKVVSEFARKTGDREVLSRTDLEILALAYEVECERNGGDWRLRKVPGQKGINGVPPSKEQQWKAGTEQNEAQEKSSETSDEAAGPVAVDASIDDVVEGLEETTLEEPSQPAEQSSTPPTNEPERIAMPEAGSEDSEGNSQDEQASDSDDGWITPSNIKQRQARDAAKAAASVETKTMQVATITTDFSMQNVLLQMNLNLLSTNNLERIRRLKSYILRCHGCFFTTREMTKQFCPRCGQPTLTRVSCSTTATGEFKMHLKKNMQWNNRGNKFSIPKPIAGTSSGKWNGDGGGKGGWGTELILAPDQKEYTRAVAENGRRARKGRDLMDEDYLPGILTGERTRTGGRVKVGAGRNVNSRRRR